MTFWRDREGDLWEEGADGLLHSRETRPFSREHVERRWGPLVAVQTAAVTAEAKPPTTAEAKPPTTAELKGLLASTTRGPWSLDNDWVLGTVTWVCELVGAVEDDTKLIALAPDLAAEVLRLRSQVERVRSLAQEASSAPKSEALPVRAMASLINAALDAEPGRSVVTRLVFGLLSRLSRRLWP